MHRSYNSYNPVASKLLAKRWDEKHFSDHRRAVTHVKPEIDSTPPVTFMHLHLKLKKLQLEEERLATIERDNRILLEKMSHTMRNKGQLDNINTAVPKSLSKGRRERELLRITRENMNMLKRIAYKKPAISRETHEKEWRENLVFLDNISSFSDKWYLKNGNRNTSRSQPNLQSERSEDTESEKSKPVKARVEPKVIPQKVILEEPRQPSPKKVEKPRTPSPEPSPSPVKAPSRVTSPQKSVSRVSSPPKSASPQKAPSRLSSPQKAASRQSTAKSIESTKSNIEDEDETIKEKNDKKEEDEYEEDFD